MNNISFNNTFHSLFEKLIRKYPSTSTTSPTSNLFKRNHQGPTSTEAHLKIPQTDEESKIRKICFSFLSKICIESGRLDRLESLETSIRCHEGKIDPRVFRALIDKLTLLKNGLVYGNKAANLIELQKLFPNRVPAFHFIDSSRVKNLLLQDDQFSKGWNRLQSKRRNQPISHFHQILNVMMDRVQYVCSNSLELDIGIRNFIEQANKDGALLVLRSSGPDEGSDKCMLSGTNKSLIGVKPQHQEVLDGIGNCIAWYFYNSLGLRHHYGLEVTNDFSCACILERQVGETRLGDPISVSGVMLTQERYGPTPNTSVITASYGADVMTGYVPCDRIFLLPSGETIKTIRKKNECLQPNNNGLARNPLELQDLCCVTDEVIAQLREIKAKLEEFYPTPMEIEFVVEKSFVYIVQARPIVDNKRSTPPSYLYLSGKENGGLFRGEVLASGGSHVLTDLDKDKIIFAHHVNEALDIFYTTEPKRRIQAVFVESPGENHTHGCSLFQSMLIPVIAFPEALRIKDANISLCPQQGIVKVTGEAIVMKGWHNHPASGVISLEHPGYRSENEISEFLFELSGEHVGLEPTSQLIEHLKSPNPAVVRRSVAALLFRLQQFIRGPLHSTSRKLQEKITILTAQVFHFGRSAYNHAENSRKMEQLLSVKIIESRLKTALESQLILEGEGFDVLAGQVRRRRDALQELGMLVYHSQHGEYAIELHRVGELILNEKVRQNWVEFLQNIFRMDDQDSLNQLLHLIHWLAQRDFLELFMNSAIPDLLEKGFSSKKILTEMIKFISKDADIINNCSKLLKNLNALSASVNGFGISSTFDRCSERLDFILSQSKLDNPLCFMEAGMIGRLSILQVYRGTVDLCDLALKTMMGSNDFRVMEHERYIRLFTPIFEMQYTLSSFLDESSEASLIKFNDVRHTTVSVKDSLANLKVLWIKKINKEGYVEFDVPSSFSVEKTKLGSPLSEYELLPRISLWELSRENCFTLCSVLRKQTSPVLTQILSSKVGPLVDKLLKLPIPDPVQQLVVNLVQADICHPWVHVQMNFYLHFSGALIDLRYHKKDGKVELQFTGMGFDVQSRWLHVFTLANVATHAIKAMSFAIGKNLAADLRKELYTFTFSFDLPNDSYESERLVDNLYQILLRIVFSLNRENDSRFISSLSGQHMQDQSIFAMALECYKLSGKRVSLVDVLSLLPPSILDRYIVDYHLWMHNIGSDHTYNAVFELLNPQCVEYLKNDRGLMTNKIHLGILTRLLIVNKEINLKARQFIEEHYSYSEIYAFIEAAIKDLSEKESGDFFIKKTLPQFTLIYPQLYDHFKHHVINCFNNTYTFDFSQSENELLCFHLNHLSTLECFHLFDRITKSASVKQNTDIGQIVPFLSSPRMLVELKKYVVKNRAWTSYFEGLLSENMYTPWSSFSSLFPSEEEKLTCLKKELSKFPELAKTCDANNLLKCITRASHKLEVIQSLEKFLTKQDVERTINKQSSFDVENFYSSTLPILYTASRRWLELYKTELLALIQPPKNGERLFDRTLPNSLAAMISDLLQESDSKTRFHYYDLLIQDTRLNKYNHDSLCLSFLQVCLCSKDTQLQNEMIEYLKRKDRWDLIFIGAWSHQEKFYFSGKNEQNAGIQLLRNLFTPERLRQHWKKEPIWSWWAPCVMIGDARLKETAFELIFGDMEVCKDMLTHFDNCKEVIEEVKLDFLSHFAALEDPILEKALEGEPRAIISIIKLTSLDKSDHLWHRLLPFLRGLPGKNPDLPNYFHKNKYEISSEKYKAMMNELGWNIPTEE
jgi:hypothetical protein